MVGDLQSEAYPQMSDGKRRPPTLRIGVHSTFAYRVVPLVLSVLGSAARALRVRDAHSDEIVAMLLDGVLDAGFILPGARPPAPRFVPLAPDPVVCVCAPAHELTRSKSVPFDNGMVASRAADAALWYEENPWHEPGSFTSAGPGGESLERI